MNLILIMRVRTTDWRQQYILLIVLQLLQRVWACPELCTCKWKNGKQTVECIDKTLQLIPGDLDHGTQVLEFSGNNLQILPKDRFKNIGLVNLQKIYMARCKISKIHDDAFKGLSNLVELDLSQNLLSVVPSPIFSDFRSLMRLILSENPIKILKSNCFQQLTFLTTLELSNCDIVLIEDEAFIGLSHLEWLKLDGNKLTTMRGSHILPDTLHGVSLHNNRWQCDCNSQDLYTWLLNFNVPHAVEPKCSSPSRLAGQNIKSLSESDLACLPDVSPTTFYLEISEGKNVSLLCQVTAVPEAKVSWWFQGQVLQNDSMVAPGIHLYYYIEEGTVEKRSELFIYNTNSEDNGTFACIAENPAGKSQSNYTIRVIVKEEPIVVVVSFPFEYVLTIAVGGGVLLVIILTIIMVLIVKCRKSERRRKKKDSSKDVVLQFPAGIAKGNSNTLCIGPLPPKLNGSIIISDQHRQTTAYSPASRDTGISGTFDGGSLCFDPAIISRYNQIEQNPDLINDAESVDKDRRIVGDDERNERTDEGGDTFDPNTVLSLPVVPKRQVTWRDGQGCGDNVTTMPRGMRQDVYRLVADVHLDPACFLDADGYPMDFGLPKLQTIQRPIMIPAECANNFYRTLPHNRGKQKPAPVQGGYPREAEFFIGPVRPPSYEHYGPADIRYTVEGYPYCPARPPQRVFTPPTDPNFVPSPPEGYKSEACCSTTRCVPTQTQPADGEAAAKPKEADSSESPDEGYVGEGGDAPDM